ncbi:MAG: phosphoribosylglycinamide formyltransferase [Pirellulaceae bacterium]|nr:phosphoribosylglycinamide formyltransferase [Pirellulaceae bacterium]
MTPLRIAVLISGGGTTLKNLLDWHKRGQLPVQFATVISSNPRAAGLQFATEQAIPTAVIRRRDFANSDQHSAAVFAHCRQHDVQLVVMGGYLEHLLIPSDFEKRVVNIHPSLIPAFCGHGFYGLRVHQAVLEFGAKVSGCTVHFVDNEYDHGPIIAQRTCPVLDDDTPEALAARVFQLECQLLPQCITAIAGGQVQVSHKRTRGFLGSS